MLAIVWCFFGDCLVKMFENGVDTMRSPTIKRSVVAFYLFCKVSFIDLKCTAVEDILRICTISRCQSNLFHAAANQPLASAVVALSRLALKYAVLFL